MKRSTATLLVVVACAGCSDDDTRGTSGTESSSTGGQKSSVVHAEIICAGVVTQVDCIESEIGQRRVDANTATFDCYTEGGRLFGELSQPFVGEIATSQTSFAEMKASCAGTPAGTFDHELTVSAGMPGSVVVTTYEAGVFMEGDFSDASGTFTGTFSIYPQM